MKWDETGFNLRDLLADLYPTIQLSMQIVRQAGVRDGQIAYHSARLSNWFNILEEAGKQDKVNDIVNLVHQEYPEKEILAIYLEHGELPAVRGVDIENDVHWRGPEDEQTLEKIIGHISSLLPISFLEIGLRKGRSVGRIERTDGGLGTGFLVEDNLLVTNNHVIGSVEEAKGARVQFNYQLSVDGLPTAAESFKLTPDKGFATSTEDDWTLVRINGDANRVWGAIQLQHAGPQVNDWVNIIQHPMGEPKQIALYHNVVVYVDDKRVQYLTDTMPGSSGSPVFNSSWHVVAVHHSGGTLREPGASSVSYRNEGIHINCIVDGKKDAGL